MNTEEALLEAKVAVFVMSCDKNIDVARYFLLSFQEFWTDCPFPKYFGVNKIKNHLEKLKFTPLESTVGGWKEETLEQLDLLKAKNGSLSHLIVILDDFVFNERVDSCEIEVVVKEALNNQVNYLMLKRVEEGVVHRTFNLFKSVFSKSRHFFEIRRSHPYYSSLQVALWNIDHLYRTIEKVNNIWEFEHCRDSSVPHFSAKRNLLSYRHIVEKSQWDRGTEEYCKDVLNFFDPGNREIRTPTLVQRFKEAGSKISFFLLGYLFLNLRRGLGKRYK